MPRRDDDWITRGFANLKRTISELQPSILKTILPMFQSLEQQQQTLSTQQGELATAQTQLASVLSSVLTPEITVGNGSNFAVPIANFTGAETDLATVCTASLPVPAGCTRAVLFGSAFAQAICKAPTGSNDYLYVRAYTKASSNTRYTYTTTPAIPAQAKTSTFYGSSFAPFGQTTVATEFDNLSGGTVSVECQVGADSHAWAADSSNSAAVNFIALFLP